MKHQYQKFYTSNRISDYEMLDSGRGRKLEKFANVILIRPEPAAIWKPKWEAKEWDKLCDFEFVEKNKQTGYWVQKGKDIPEDWYLPFEYKGCNIRLNLKLTAFKHIGIFPEQSINWQYIYDNIQESKADIPKVLNLFAYTGGASLVAKAAGADVTHVDSIRQVVTWANQNRESSRLKDIRWIIEDAVKFVKREVKRGNLYNGIILDPPAFGHGPKGQKWKLETDLYGLMTNVFQLLDPNDSFLLLNVYSAGYGADQLQQLMKDINPRAKNYLIGDIYTNSAHSNDLFQGSVLRLESK